jgi:hypothetical protein
MAVITVTHDWTDEKGVCYECGDPAAFCVPFAYGPNHKLDEVNLRCAVCAANIAAYEGETIVGLFPDDTDGLYHTEWANVINTYPIKKETA